MIITECYIDNMEKEKPKKTPFGAALRHYREQAGLTQPELAELVKVSQATITKLETGKLNGKIDTRDMIFQWAGKTHDEFLKKGREILAKNNILPHKNILDEFSDKDSAEAAMKDLLYIEQHSPKLFYGIIKRLGWEKTDLENSRKKRTTGNGKA
jgi:transcriptional regulator with XRE-family HTH domain